MAFDVSLLIAIRTSIIPFRYPSNPALESSGEISTLSLSLNL